MYTSQQTIPVKNHIVNIFSFAGCMVFVTTIQYYPYSTKAILDNKLSKWAWLCADKTLFIKKAGVHSLQISAV